MNKTKLISRALHSVKQKQQSSLQQQCDLISPPNPVTNLRQVKLAVRENETELEKLLRQKEEELHLWNEGFWKKHNESFVEEKQNFINNVIKRKGGSKENVTSDELSIFYKDFLDKNWRNHFNYNINWCKQHFYVTFLDFRVRLQRLLKKITTVN
ncbi:UNVERIFIED_CONTAM: hypothetical protein PYX00_009059 [Menopon gallinae]|uniref:APOPT family protein CG14806, mitochondrial n=1 Tax=Menopon gallinae TaxID=328185 RepID=A0AAW2H9M4_9NEOP